MVRNPATAARIALVEAQGRRMNAKVDAMRRQLVLIAISVVAIGLVAVADLLAG